MAGSFRVYVDVAGSDGLAHVYIGITDSSGTQEYSGYGPVSTAPFGVPGRVSHGLEPADPDDPKNVAGYMDQTAWASPAYAISDEQIAAMNAKIQEWEDNPGTYTIFANHCATMVSDVLDAGGIDYPKSGVTNHPDNFIPWSDKSKFYQDIDGNPATGGSLSDRALNPGSYEGTPAYDYLQNKAKQFWDNFFDELSALRDLSDAISDGSSSS